MLVSQLVSAGRIGPVRAAMDTGQGDVDGMEGLGSRWRFSPAPPGCVGGLVYTLMWPGGLFKILQEQIKQIHPDHRRVWRLASTDVGWRRRMSAGTAITINHKS